MTALILKRASISRPAGEWNDDDFDVLANGVVVGRIFKANAAPVGSPWMWTLAFGHHLKESSAEATTEPRIRLWPSRLILSRAIRSVFSGLKRTYNCAAVSARSAPCRLIG
jgi:hypothetical protein